MKRITLLFFLLFMSFLGYSQFPEGFETTPWTPSGPVGWGIYQNAPIGPAQQWRQTVGYPDNPVEPVHSGTFAAYIGRENVPNTTPPDPAQDWLVTPVLTLPANAQLRFWSALVAPGVQGGVFKIKIIPATGPNSDASVLSNYTDVITWTEATLNPAGNLIYEEKIVPLPAMAGQVRIAFFMEGDNADSWLVDDVNVVSECFIPTGLAASNIGTTTANLTWAAGTATQWEVEVVETALSPTGIAEATVSTTPAYSPTGPNALNPDTAYKYYVRAICSPGNPSPWAGPFNFSTVGIGDTCAAPIVIGALPYSAIDNTTGYGDDFDGTPGATGCGTTAAYLNGNEVVYAYTPTVSGNIGINVSGFSAAAGLFVYDSCADIGSNCIAGGIGTATTPVNIPLLAVTAGTTYYIVISSTGQTTAYNLVCQVVNCAQPSGLTATNVDENSADLSWAVTGGATSWEVVVQNQGAGIPAGSGTTTPVNTNFNVTHTYAGAPLAPSTSYEYYVRADCNNTTFSAWTGPFTFTTTQIPGTLPYTDGFEGTPQWTLSNHATLPNRWVTGNAVNNGGTQSLYISNNNGVANAYTTATTTMVVHAYRDIIIPSTAGQVSVSFDWKCQGESTFDYLRAWLVPASFTPTVGTQIPAAAGRIPLGANFNLNNTWSTPTYVANVTGGTVMRLVFEWRNDGSGGTQPPAAVDNINIAVISCPSPTALGVTNVEEDQATLTWTASTPAPGTGYDYYYSTTNTAPTASTPAMGSVGPAATTAVISPLTPSTQYYAWVRSNCGPGDTSFWVGPVAFTTTQIPANLNYTEDFEGTIGWTLSNGTQTNKWYVGNFVNNGGTNALYVSNSNGTNNNYTNNATSVVHAYRDIQLPPGVQDVNFSFDWKSGGESTFDYIRAWIVPTSYVPTPGTQVAPAANRIPLGGNHNLQTAWQTASYTQNLNAYQSTIVRVVFEWRNDFTAGTNPAGAVDNINISVITCPVPTALTISNLQEDEATLGWTAPTYTTPSYDYYLSTTNTAPTASTPETGDVLTGTSINLTPLIPSTIYYAWVRSDCGGTDKSFWVGPIQFITPQIPAAMDFTEGFETNPTTWFLNNGTQANKWVVGNAVSNGGTQSLYISSDNGATHTYVNTTSTVHAYRDIQMPPTPMQQLNLTFDWHALGDTGDYLKVWIAPITFNPTPGTLITAAQATLLSPTANLNGSANFTTTTYIIPAATGFSGQAKRLIFEWRNDTSVGGNPPAAVDNINLSVVTCMAPTAPAVTAVAQTTATASWTAPVVAPANYDYYLSTSNTPPVEATVPTGDNLTALTTPLAVSPSTTYYFWVRSDCGGGDVSVWTGPVVFSTLQVPASLDFSEDFEGTISWTLSNGTQTNKWYVGNAVNNGGTNALYVSNNGGTANTYTNNATSVVHAYRDIQLPPVVGDVDITFDWRAAGESTFDYIRVWIVPLAYNPTPGTQITPGAGRIPIGGNFNQQGTVWQSAGFIQSLSTVQNTTVRLVFEWRNDGIIGTNPAGAIDNIDISIITCPKPTTLSANPGQTDVILNWTEPGTATEWEVYVIEPGSPLPTDATVGTPAPAHPFTYNIDIEPATSYVYYVRSVCSLTDKSKWAGPFAFVTDIANDDCAGATEVPVNPTQVCDEVTRVMFTGATVSPQASDCLTTANGGDVWYEFVAEQSAHTIEISNFAGPAQPIVLALYEGDVCGTLTQVDCSINNVITASQLEIGATYKIRVSIGLATAQLTTSFDLCVNTPPPPSDENPTECVITTINYDFELPNANGTHPNFINHNTVPGWRTTASDQIIEYWPAPNYENVPAYSGDQFIELNANLVSGVYQDYDTPGGTVFTYSFAHRGRQGTDTIQLYAGPPGAEVPVGAPVSSSNTAWTFNTGTYTVPANQPVTRFRFQSVSSVGGATIGNFLDAITFVADNGILSANPMDVDCENNIANISAAGTGVWSAHAGNPSDTVIAVPGDNNTSITGFEVTGSYFYEWTTEYCSSTLEIVFDGGNVPVPTVVNTVYNYCTDETATQLTATADAGHTLHWYTVPVNGTPLADAPTPDTTIAGTTTYYVNQSSAEGCVSPRVAIDVIVHAVPNEPVVSDMVYCSGDTAVQLTATADAGNTLNWYTDPVGGTPLADAPTPSTTVAGTTTYYVSQSIIAGCESTRAAIVVTVNPTPAFTLDGLSAICEDQTATITVIPANFDIADATYTWTQDGNPMAETNASITVNTAATYEVTVTLGDCSSTVSKVLNVDTIPVVDQPVDVTECDQFVLPALVNAGNYFTGPAGTGEQLFADELVTSTQRIYIFAQNGTCSAESSFMVTINTTPSFNLGGPYVVCDPGLTILEVNAANFDTAEAAYVWTFDGNAVGEDAPSLQGIGFGTYEVTVTVNGCSHTESITIAEDTDAFALALPHGCDGTVYMINVAPVEDENGNLSFDPETSEISWTGPNGFSSYEASSAVTVEGIYNVTITTVDGCISQGTVEVESTSCMIPRGISPNGDTLNDNFDLTGFNVAKLSIFNRYGREVYSKTNYTNEWYGQTDGGDELPTGTYFYSMQRSNGETRTGWVYINRQEN